MYSCSRISRIPSGRKVNVCVQTGFFSRNFKKKSQKAPSFLFFCTWDVYISVDHHSCYATRIVINVAIFMKLFEPTRVYSTEKTRVDNKFDSKTQSIKFYTFN